MQRHLTGWMHINLNVHFPVTHFRHRMRFHCHCLSRVLNTSYYCSDVQTEETEITTIQLLGDSECEIKITNHTLDVISLTLRTQIITFNPIANGSG